jgi:hypothetical protein
MKSIADLAPGIQKRISGLVNFLKGKRFSRPEVKNIESLMSAMLKKHDIHVSVLSRSLDERIAPKKTWERLSRNLRRKGLGERVLEANAEKNLAAIREKRYCVVDVSDIQKPYAEQMEGLGRVRDGDKSKRGEPVIGNGLYWINGVMVDESEILPVYSEIYGLDHEGRDHTSENTKIQS